MITLKVIAKITVNNPPKIKNENGKKEIVQINSHKPSAIPREKTKICRRLFKLNNSPARRLIKSPFQKIKNDTKLRVTSPAINPTF